MTNFYKCYECNINLCDKCQMNHDYSHNIMNFGDINYFCGKHKDSFAKYCNNCKIDICCLCEEEHSGHKLTYYGRIISDKRHLKINLEKIKQCIDKYDKNCMEITKKVNDSKNIIIDYDIYNEIGKSYEGIIMIVNEVKNIFNSFYNLKKDIINEFDNSKKYYHLLINLKEINDNNDLVEDINKITQENNIKKKFENIIKIYKKINNISEEEILIFDVEKIELKEKVKKLKKIYKDLEEENEQIKTEIKELEEKNKDLEEKNDQISKEKVKDSQKKYKYLEEEYKQTTTYMKEIKELNLKLNEENALLKLNNRDLEEKNKQLKKGNEIFEEREKDLKKDINNLEKNIKQLNKEKEQIEKLKKDINKELEKVKIKNDNLEKELKNKIELNKLINNNLKNDYNDIKSENDKLLKKINNIELENEEKQKKLEKENKELKSENDNLKKESKNLYTKSKILDLEKQLKTKSSLIEKNIKENKELTNKIDNLIKELNEEKKKRIEIEDKLDKKENNNNMFYQTFNNFNQRGINTDRRQGRNRNYYLDNLSNERDYNNLSFKIENDSCSNCKKNSEIKEKIEKENNLMKKKISELEKKNEILTNENNKLIENNNQTENNYKSSLINHVIEKGLNQNTKMCEKYNLENKFLIIELIQKEYIKSEKVADVMLEVDRGDFTPQNIYEKSPQYKYANRPISIGFNVTISAPHMHAFALEYLSEYCTPYSKILDVGCGSGYLTLALSKMTTDTATVVGIEHIPELHSFGIKNIEKCNSDLIKKGKIIIKNGDGRQGCKEYGPYKAIHVGACSEFYPKELIEQLDYNGRMFIPIGKKGGEQNIYLIDKDFNGNVTYKAILPVCYGMLTDINSQLYQ